MSDLIYQGNIKDADIPSEPQAFDTGLRTTLDDPSGYLPHPDLVKAVNAAMFLGQPLLLSGAPGVGKSSLAKSVARALALGPVAEVYCKADMSSADLFYSFDHMRRLFDANSVQPGHKVPDIETYLEFKPLGAAILRAAGPDNVTRPIEGMNAPERTLRDLAGDSIFERPVGQSVVLLDEIDKAPRDVPNDILNEIDKMEFKIPELGQTIEAPKNKRPFVVMTSNSERNLPAPFLRRCVFFSIPFPSLRSLKGASFANESAPTVEDIVSTRIVRVKGTRLLNDALDVFGALRDPRHGLRQPPSPAELMNWLLLLLQVLNNDAEVDLTSHRAAALDYLSVLLKEEEDQIVGRGVVEAWLNTPS